MVVVVVVVVDLVLLLDDPHVQDLPPDHQPGPDDRPVLPHDPHEDVG